ncbi:TetR/AcrR family transcriptional regulator [Humibacter ginsenosidimutans]|uniref:TetR/AcrR family transcriptional regulator n=1 Tax=Humibacter ginsenosidimutans TaxID=2599293 RepID=A0A5B8M6U6_9MICO|nr:TetR/AcrR family transcriptional regulator [Humibacter ginsenosidimutans]QDZ15859.1 TetR/AcrR family transcriptional regulator [Humibacter ginsenosidimutans]
MPVGQKNAERTREAILDAAAFEFTRFGLSGARLDRIISATGMTKGAFYFHFKSKDALADALLESRFDPWPRMLQAVRDEGGRGLSGMRLLAVRVVREMATNTRIRAGMRLSQELRLVPSAGNPYEDWAQRFVPFLDEAVADQDAPESIDRLRTARTLVNCLFGVLAVCVDSGMESHVDSELEALWRLLTPGLRTGGGG